MTIQKPNTSKETVIFYYDGFSKPVFIGNTLQDLESELFGVAKEDRVDESIYEPMSTELANSWNDSFIDINLETYAYNLHVAPSLEDMTRRLTSVNSFIYGFDNPERHLDALIEDVVYQSTKQSVTSLTN